MRIALLLASLTLASCVGCEKEIHEAKLNRAAGTPVVVIDVAQDRHAG